MNLGIFFRYLLFLPVAIIASILFSLITHFIIKAFCLFPAYWTMDACRAGRPFFVELILLFSFVQLSVLIIPRFKKILALIELIPIGLFYIFTSLLGLIINKTMSNWFDIFILGLLALLAAAFIIKDNKDYKLIVFNQDVHFCKLEPKDNKDDNPADSCMK